MSTETPTVESVPVATTSDAQPDVRPREESGLKAVAHDLLPFIREHAAEAEKKRRLSPVVIDALREAGVFRLLLPRSFGGLEIDPISYALITEDRARRQRGRVDSTSRQRRCVVGVALSSSGS